MRLPPRTLAAIVDGRVDLAFRRWERPRVRAGGTQRTAVGVIGFDAVEPVDRDQVTEKAARRAGFETRDQLLSFLDRRREGTIYQVRLRLAGPDPRVALRAQPPDKAQTADILRRLARLDRASSHGPWTRSVLELINARPETRAGDLAAELGRERLPFKVDVRKLKELGLTESLPIGYRLSPRGRAILDKLEVSGAPGDSGSRHRPSSRPRPPADR
jgi:hypothetical protein